MQQTNVIYEKRDFWIQENLRYSAPHFRMEKAARLINSIARGRECDLLDVGCGPAALRQLLSKNLRYHGIDIAIHNVGPDVVQTDFLDSRIAFGDKKFDIILAQGVFEYVGNFQSQKFREIAEILRENGKFIVSYVNFDHWKRNIYGPYNNVQSSENFRKSLAQFFHIERICPTSHRWHHDEPRRRLMKAVQMHINWNIPWISPIFAVEYFFICSLPGSRRS
jgi:SAM-dependent methyltransferase